MEHDGEGGCRVDGKRHADHSQSEKNQQPAALAAGILLSREEVVHAGRRQEKEMRGASRSGSAISSRVAGAKPNESAMMEAGKSSRAVL